MLTEQEIECRRRDLANIILREVASPAGIEPAIFPSYHYGFRRPGDGFAVWTLS